MVMVSGKNSKIARMDADPDDVHSMVTSLSTDISLINCLTSSFYVKLLTDRQTDRQTTTRQNTSFFGRGNCMINEDVV